MESVYTLKKGTDINDRDIRVRGERERVISIIYRMSHKDVLLITFIEK